MQGCRPVPSGRAVFHYQLTSIKASHSRARASHSAARGQTPAFPGDRLRLTGPGAEGCAPCARQPIRRVYGVVVPKTADTQRSRHDYEGGFFMSPQHDHSLWEVSVLWEGDRNDPSEPQGDERERVAERGGVARPAGRRTGIGYEAWPTRASGHVTAKLSRSNVRLRRIRRSCSDSEWHYLGRSRFMPETATHRRDLWRCLPTRPEYSRTWTSGYTADCVC